MSDSIGAVILAAGEGKRLKLDIPKPLAPIMGRKLIDYPLMSVRSFLKKQKLQGAITAVVGHQKDMIKAHISEVDPAVKFALQEQQKGTADALRAYFDSSEETKKHLYTLIMCADTPIIEDADLELLYNELVSKKLDGVVATFEEDDPYGYGRIVRAKKGFSIVEEKDASDAQRTIKEVNSGLYLLKTKFILENLEKIGSNNKAQEFYLTDLFQEGLNIAPVLFENKETFLGVNTLKQLEKSERIIRWRYMEKLRDEGVRFIDLGHTYVDDSVVIESGVTIYPNSFIRGKTLIEKDVVIGPGCVISDSTISKGSEVKAYSVISETKLGENVAIGPFAHLRPGTEIGAESKIGNFVEVKKSTLDKGVKVSHLSYVGDAEIGEESNIGCGFVTCNYDGAQKHKTKIGKGTFIGSDSQTIAPVDIGDNCYVASGSTINQNMPNGSFAIARSRQVTKEKMAKRFLKSKSEGRC